MSFLVRLFTRFTSFDPDHLDWAKRQEEAALTSAKDIRRSNAIERELLARRKS